MTAPSLIRALLDLLRDDDPRTWEALFRQFGSMGDEGLAILDRVQQEDDAQLRVRSRQLAWELRTEQVTRDFEALAEQPEPDLEQAIILLARLERPAVDASQIRGELDRLGALVRAEVDGLGTGREKALVLGRILHAREGFDGDVHQYYDPRNSYVDQVLERRRGIPISLSAIYILAGRRAGLELRGVGFPMHFLVALTEGAERTLVDPYRGGRVLTREACRTLLAGFNQTFREEYLAPVTDRRMLRRMLANLVHVYQEKGDQLRLGRLFRLVNILQESSP